MLHKRDLVKEIYTDLKAEGIVTSLRDAQKVYEIVINCIINKIKLGYDVKLLEFGTFLSKLSNRRNPQNQEKIKIWTINFKASKNLTSELNKKK